MPSVLPSRRPLAILVIVLAGLLSGTLVVSGVGLATGTGLLAGESDSSKALRVLRADQKELVRATEQLSSSERLDDLHAVARTSDELLADATERDARLAVLEDPEVKGPAERAHRATVALLRAFAELRAVDEEDLDGWSDAERDAIAALGELDSAAAPVAALDAERPLRLDGRAVEQAVEATSKYLTSSARRLARYERRMAKFRRRNRTKLQAAADYKATVLTQMSAYNETRDDLQSYLDDTHKFDDQIDAFRSELQDAKAARQGIRGTLASIEPPGALQGEHQRLIAVLDHAITATDIGVDLADATQRLRDDGDFGTSGFDLPEYDELVDQSEQITTERDAAMSNFGSSIDTYLRRLKHPKGAPKRPKI